MTSEMRARRLYILCWSELSRRRLLPAVSPAAGHLTTPTVAGLPSLCENFRPTTSKSSPILRLLSSHWATSVVRTRVVGVANVGDSLRRLSSLQHRIYNLLGCVLQCAATVRGRLDRVEQRLARERADCDDDKARAEQRILSQVAHARVSPLLSLAYAVIAPSTTGSAGRQEC